MKSPPLAAVLRSFSLLYFVSLAFPACASSAGPTLVRTFSNPTPGMLDNFGAAVATEGNYVLIGAPRDDTDGMDSGRAFLFDADTGNLLHTFSDPNPDANIKFAQSVAIQDNLIVIGAPDHRSGRLQGAGQAFVFDAVTGSLLRTINNPSPMSGDDFGWDVAIDGGRILVGADLDGAIVNNSSVSRAGRAFLFDAADGSLLHTFQDPTPASLDVFGIAVAIQGDTVLISASLDDTTGNDDGHVLVFDAVSGELQKTLINPDASSYYFGNKVAIDEGKIVIGELRTNAPSMNSGRAYIFDAQSGTSLHTLLKPNDPKPLQLFGSEVAISGDNVFVAISPIPYEEANQVFIFDSTTGELRYTLDDPTNPPYGKNFGYAIAASGNRVVIGAIGAYLDSGNASPGTVYLYELSVPEPSSRLLLSFGLCLGMIRQRRRTR